MNLLSSLSELEDFRIKNKCHHKLSDILLIGLFTYLSNGEDYEDMVLFAESHYDFVKQYCELPKGIPSHDTFNRIFKHLNPSVLRDLLRDYGKEVLDILSEKQICIDGKKLRGVSPTSKGNQGLYIVNAWVAENNLCIGQQKVEDKSNEITAIPKIISQLDIENATVSIDAIGCQKEIVRQIIEQKGHYLLSVKANQGDLYDEIVGGFKAIRSSDFSEQWEYQNSRFETRKCSIIKASAVMLPEVLSQWKGLKTLVKIESERFLNNEKQVQTRYYISNEESENASYYNALVRGHWSIENQLHWHLDVTFREDKCRARAGFSAENLSSLRKLALQIIKSANDKLSLKKRRLKAGYSTKYLQKLISCV
ncbi:MAG: ISAs1 family transposase [Flavobacteriaceae bacterium]|nr:ISAs1 family transposase [Flavobacteriaceae bacterium]